MYWIELPLDDFRLIGNAPGVAYQAARWMKRFHQLPYSHIGWSDHTGDTPMPGVLHKYGFIRVVRFELNEVHLLLQTYGPLLIKGALSHLAQHEVQVPTPEITLMRVSAYEEADHALLLNGYSNELRPMLLFCDPEHPRRQFVEELSVLRARLDESAIGVFYLNCPVYPKPCVHVTGASRTDKRHLVVAPKREPFAPEPEPTETEEA